MANNSQNLKAHYNPESDALYLGLKKGSEESFLEIAPGLNLEVNEHGQISQTPGAAQVAENR